MCYYRQVLWAFFFLPLSSIATKWRLSRVLSGRFGLQPASVFIFQACRWHWFRIGNYTESVSPPFHRRPTVVNSTYNQKPLFRSFLHLWKGRVSNQGSEIPTFLKKLCPMVTTPNSYYNRDFLLNLQIRGLIFLLKPIIYRWFYTILEEEHLFHYRLLYNIPSGLCEHLVGHFSTF